MLDLYATIGLHLAIVAVFTAIWRYLLHEPVRPAPLLLGLGCVLIYFTLIIAGSELSDRIPAMSGLKWNWLGKIVAIATTLVLMRLIPKALRQDYGLTWRQTAGSLLPALLVIAAMCAFAWGIEAFSADGTDTSVETLAFQGSLPGLDEELFFRGLLLALFGAAFSDRWRLMGVAAGPALAAITFLFAAGHGLRIADGHLAFSLLAFTVTGVLGLGLIWLRRRTGSLLLPMVAHNLVNFGLQFL